MVLAKRHRLFCEAYVECGDVREAALRAGYAERVAEAYGQRNLRLPVVQDEIERLQAAGGAVKRHEKKHLSKNGLKKHDKKHEKSEKKKNSVKKRSERQKLSGGSMSEGAVYEIGRLGKISGVADSVEILQFLTEVMRGEVRDSRSLVDKSSGGIVEVADPPKVSERTKAAELLGRNQHLFSDKGKNGVERKCVVRIFGEDELPE
jgi:hypothetical protein